MDKAGLKIDWATHAAAKNSCENWHYSKRIPMPPLNMVGVWECGVYVGCVLFGRGANNAIGKEYGLDMTTCCELVRVALKGHATPVSRIVSISIKFLKKQNPHIRLIVSYADRQQGHTGAIYQAGNWVYVGLGSGSIEYFHDGRWKHNREITSGAFGRSRKYDPSLLPKRKTLGKHKYLYPLDDAMRKQILPLSKPYPKRAASIENDAPALQRDEGGEIPTAALHSSTGSQCAT
jgi:hypothetical protein